MSNTPDFMEPGGGSPPLTDEVDFCAGGRRKPDCDESRAQCFAGQPMSEKLAYWWAHQCLRDINAGVTVEQHIVEQLLDRVASAVIESAKRERAIAAKDDEREMLTSARWTSCGPGYWARLERGGLAVVQSEEKPDEGDDRRKREWDEAFPGSALWSFTFNANSSPEHADHYVYGFHLPGVYAVGDSWQTSASRARLEPGFRAAFDNALARLKGDQP